MKKRKSRRVLLRHSLQYSKTMKEVYNQLVTFRKHLEEEGEYEYAKEIEYLYRQFWVESINEPFPG